MKQLLLILLVLFSIVMTAQQRVDSLEITPDGLNGYVVVDFPGMTADEIYQNAKDWSIYNLKNAELANFREIKGEVLGYELLLPKGLYAKAIGSKYYYDLIMDVDMRFKDGRMRVDISNLYMPPAHNSNPEPMEIRGSFLKLSIFNQKGKITKQGIEVKESIDKTFNEFINQLKEGILRPDNKDDW